MLIQQLGKELNLFGQAYLEELVRARYPNAQIRGIIPRNFIKEELEASPNTLYFGQVRSEAFKLYLGDQATVQMPGARLTTPAAGGATITTWEPSGNQVLMLFTAFTGLTEFIGWQITIDQDITTDPVVDPPPPDPSDVVYFGTTPKVFQHYDAGTDTYNGGVLVEKINYSFWKRLKIDTLTSLVMDDVGTKQILFTNELGEVDPLPETAELLTEEEELITEVPIDITVPQLLRIDVTNRLNRNKPTRDFWGTIRVTAIGCNSELEEVTTPLQAILYANSPSAFDLTSISAAVFKVFIEFEYGGGWLPIPTEFYFTNV